MNSRDCYERFSPILWLKPGNIKEIVNRTDVFERLLGISIILNMLGYKEIHNPNLEPIILTDKSFLTNVIINNGKLYSILPKKPLFKYIPIIRETSLKILISNFQNQDKNSFLFWPLNWKPEVPRTFREYLPGLIKFNEDIYVGIPELNPWNTVEKTINRKKTKKISLSEEIFDFVLEPLRIKVKKQFLIHKNIIVSKDLNLITNTNKKIVHIIYPVETKIKLSCYDYYVYLLHPGGWLSTFINSDNPMELESCSIIIKCPKGSAFISSPRGFKIRAKPAEISIESQNSIILGRGSYINAAKALLELLFKPIELNYKLNLGSPRGEALVILNGISDNLIRMFVWNPVPKRVFFESRFYLPVTSAEMLDPLGKYELFIERGLIKIPLSPSWMGCLELRLKGSLR